MKAFVEQKENDGRDQMILNEIERLKLRIKVKEFELKKPVHIILETQDDIDNFYNLFGFLKSVSKYVLNCTSHSEIAKNLQIISEPWASCIMSLVSDNKYEKILNLLKNQSDT